MEIKARYISGTAEELENLPAIIEDMEATTLAQHERAGSRDHARSQRVHTLGLRELYLELDAALRLELEPGTEPAHLDGLDYVSTQWSYDLCGYSETRTAEAIKARGFAKLTDTTTLDDVRYRWLAVYPVTGGSEGHYVHIELIWQRDWNEGRVPLMLAKTFGGHAAAVALAGAVARILGV